MCRWCTCSRRWAAPWARWPAGAWRRRCPEPPWARPLLAVGVLGGYTTYSAFAVETVGLAEAGAPWLAAGYVLVSVLGGGLAGGRRHSPGDRRPGGHRLLRHADHLLDLRRRRAADDRAATARPWPAPPARLRRPGGGCRRARVSPDL